MPWARKGKMLQALAFGVSAGVVMVIGIGGYIPEMWLDSTKRIAMSPWQVVAVLIAMAVVIGIDIPLF